MNKTYLIVGGASVASLAVGSVSGYFFAKNKLTKKFEAQLAEEIAETKKFYSIQKMESHKPAPEELLQAKAPQTEEEAEEALTKYQGRFPTVLVENPDPSEIVNNNIFTGSRPPQPRQGRGPDGKFLPKKNNSVLVQEDLEETDDSSPYMISQEEFATTDESRETASLKWFPDERVLLDDQNESVDIDRVGEANLTLFGHDPNHSDDYIYVRNDFLEVDYEIERRESSVAEHMNIDYDAPDPVELEDLRED